MADLLYNEVFEVDKFTDPNHLLERFYDYLDWLEENKLKESKLYGTEGAVAQLDRMRIPTMQGFQFFLRTVKRVMDMYRSRSLVWEDAFCFIEDTMNALSVEGAAAGLLKESIVMRKLGMADKVETNTTQRRVVILHTPDNGRAILQERSEPDDAEEVDEE